MILTPFFLKKNKKFKKSNLFKSFFFPFFTFHSTSSALFSGQFNPATDPGSKPKAYIFQNSLSKEFLWDISAHADPHSSTFWQVLRDLEGLEAELLSSLRRSWARQRTKKFQRSRQQKDLSSWQRRRALSAARVSQLARHKQTIVVRFAVVSAGCFNRASFAPLASFQGGRAPIASTPGVWILAANLPPFFWRPEATPDFGKLISRPTDRGMLSQGQGQVPVTFLGACTPAHPPDQPLYPILQPVGQPMEVVDQRHQQQVQSQPVQQQVQPQPMQQQVQPQPMQQQVQSQPVQQQVQPQPMQQPVQPQPQPMQQPAQPQPVQQPADVPPPQPQPVQPWASQHGSIFDFQRRGNFDSDSSYKTAVGGITPLRDGEGLFAEGGNPVEDAGGVPEALRTDLLSGQGRQKSIDHQERVPASGPFCERAQASALGQGIEEELKVGPDGRLDMGFLSGDHNPQAPATFGNSLLQCPVLQHLALANGQVGGLEGDKASPPESVLEDGSASGSASSFESEEEGNFDSDSSYKTAVGEALLYQKPNHGSNSSYKTASAGESSAVPPAPLRDSSRLSAVRRDLVEYDGGAGDAPAPLNHDSLSDQGWQQLGGQEGPAKAYSQPRPVEGFLDLLAEHGDSRSLQASFGQSIRSGQASRVAHPQGLPLDSQPSQDLLLDAKAPAGDFGMENYGMGDPEEPAPGPANIPLGRRSIQESSVSGATVRQSVEQNIEKMDQSGDFFRRGLAAPSRLDENSVSDCFSGQEGLSSRHNRSHHSAPSAPRLFALVEEDLRSLNEPSQVERGGDDPEEPAPGPEPEPEQAPIGAFLGQRSVQESSVDDATARQELANSLKNVNQGSAFSANAPSEHEERAADERQVRAHPFQPRMQHLNEVRACQLRLGLEGLVEESKSRNQEHEEGSKRREDKRRERKMRKGNVVDRHDIRRVVSLYDQMHQDYAGYMNDTSAAPASGGQASLPDQIQVENQPRQRPGLWSRTWNAMQQWGRVITRSMCGPYDQQYD